MATADTSTICDIKNLLQMNDSKVFRHSFNRPNLSINVFEKSPNAIKDVVALIKQSFSNDTDILYCRTKKECESVHKSLSDNGLKAMVYHSAIKETKKEKVLQAWMCDEIRIVIATIAFGLGR